MQKPDGSQETESGAEKREKNNAGTESGNMQWNEGENQSYEWKWHKYGSRSWDHS